MTQLKLHLVRPLCCLEGSHSEPHTTGTGVCTGLLSLLANLLIYVSICLLSGLTVTDVVDLVTELVPAAVSTAPQWRLGP